MPGTPKQEAVEICLTTSLKYLEESKLLLPIQINADYEAETYIFSLKGCAVAGYSQRAHLQCSSASPG